MENGIREANKEVTKQKDVRGKIFKIIVVGDSNVGKTSLTYRFCDGKFLDSPEATVGVDFRSRTLMIDDEKITLQLWDTAGQERFRKTMVRHYYRNADAIVFVFDVSEAASFDSLKKWLVEVDQHCPPDLPRILVGNKCDKNVAVTTTVAQTFADQHDMPLFETSAQMDSQCDNVDSIFLTLAHKLKNQKPFITPRTERLEVSDRGSESWLRGCC